MSNGITKVNNVFTSYALDDFDETKNYHRVLFKPGVSVQARELTQLQTALQKQIDYHGQYSFIDGQRVLGGKSSVDVGYDFIQVEDVFQSSISGSSVRHTTSSYLDELKGTTLTGQTSGIKAKVLQVITAGGVDANDTTKTGILDSGTSDPITLYIKYTRSDAAGDADTAADTVFTAGENLTQSGGSSTRYVKVGGLTAQNATSTEYVGTTAGGDDTNGGSAISAGDATGTGSIAHIEEGCYFVNGTFIYVAGQSLILNKYANTPSFIVGLNIVESVVTSVTDTSLVDNASGFPNVSAPGADRYKIQATLVKTEDDGTPNSTFKNLITLFKIAAGIVQVNTADTQGNTELTQRLARRTSEESGDYSLSPFKFNVREHLDTGTNGGLFTSANGGVATKVAVGVEPNTVYVKGYRYENLATKYIAIDKPRTFETKKSTNFQLTGGNYVKATLSTVRGVPDVNNHTLATLQTGSDAADGICHFSAATNLTVADRTERTIIVTEGVTAGVSVNTGTDGSGLKLRLTTDEAGSTKVEVVEAGTGYGTDTQITITNNAAALGGSGASIVLSGATKGIGTCRIKDMTFESSTLVRIYLYDININGSVASENTFANVARIHQLDETSNADQFEATLSTVGALFGTQSNSLVFPIPFHAIKDVASTTKPIYQVRRKFQADIANGTTTHSFSIAATESVITSDAYLSQGTAQPYLLPGDDVTITYDSSNNQIDLAGLDGNKHIELICTIQRTGATSTRKSKTYTTPAEATFTFDGTNKVPLNKGDVKEILSAYNGDKRVTFATHGSSVGTNGGTTIALASADISTIKVGMTVSLESANTGTTVPTIYGKVLSANNSTDVITLDRTVATMPGTGVNLNFDVDVKDNFRLDDGQRENFYDEAALIPIGTQAAITALKVKFAFYAHGTGDYFVADSYQAGQYDTIPSFQSAEGEIELRDAMDFRPLKATLGSITPGKEFTTGTGGVLTALPKPDSNVIADVEYYLARIDKIIIDRAGQYRTITGTPATPIEVTAPSDIDDALTIGTLEMNGYVDDINETQVYAHQHKRYTMKDIGTIDNRVKTLEYYTSLNFLENTANNEFLADGTNGQRFKNGIFVDSFKGHQNAFASHPDYQISIDRENGLIRPHTNVQNVPLQRYANDLATSGTKPMSSTIVQNNSIYTLPFTHTAFVTQPYASYAEKVNPYNIFTWGGIVTLSPESDEWKDTEHRPDIVEDNEGVFDSLMAGINESNVLGTVWGEWETTWSGVTQTFRGTRRGRWLRGRWGARMSTTFRRVNGRRQRIRTFTRGDVVTNRQSRQGFRNDVVIDTQLETVADKVVETSLIPFIRSRKIYFNAQLLKPNTKMYAFFNGTSVADYVREESSFVEWSARADSASTLYTDDEAHHAGAGALTTDDAGQVIGSFVIPNKEGLRFPTGTRQFRLSDSATGDTSKETTFAEADYTAKGVLETRQREILSTRIPRVVTSEVSADRTVEDRSGLQTRVFTDWSDPLAQTFLIDQSGGLFITKLDIFVAQEDPSIPLRVSVREVENGIPTQRIVPGTDQIVYPSAITPDATDGSVATTVTFDFPVYLTERTEYAIVLMSQSDNYKVWVAEQGKLDIQDPTFRINKQPYNGVFFTSQNASTWTPEQNKDLKFTLYRANFTTNGNAAARTANFVNAAMPATKLPNNPFTYVSNSTHTVIRVKHPNHGLYCGPQAGDANHENKVTIAGFVDGDNGLAASAVNAAHDVHDIELDSYCITIDNDAATTTGITGGGNAITAIGQIQFDALYCTNQSLSVPGTSLAYSLEGQTGKSVDGADTVRGQAMNYTKVTGMNIYANETNYFDAPFVIASAVNEAAKTTDSSFLTKSLGVSVTFTSDSSFLSPVIDGTRCSVHAIQNRTNDATGHDATLPTSESGLDNQSDNYGDSAAGRTYVANTSPVGTSDANRYISKIVTLADPATTLRVHFTASRPAGSNIYLYFKALTADQAEVDFDTIDWTYASPTDAIPLSDYGTTNEIEYDITPTSSFVYFAFKVVLTSTDSANVPTVAAFRAIAAT